MAAANTPSLQDIVFDGLNYEIWAPVAKTTLVGKGLWDVVENGVPPDPSKIPELAATIQAEELSKWRDLAAKDMKALQILQSSLTDSAFRKTLSAASAKEVWDLLKKGNEQPKLLTLEKQFEQLSMDEGESIESYLGRIMIIVEQIRRLGKTKSDYEVITKLVASVCKPYNVMAPILVEHCDLKNMTIESIVEFFHISDSMAEDLINLMFEDMRLESKSGKWCGVCNKNNHNEEECYFIPSDSRQAKERKGKCFDCGERGHYARECKRKNQQQAAREAQVEETEADYLMLEETLGDITFDEDMWMLCVNTSNHMTPYVKNFTYLDRTEKAKVGLVDGRVIMAEGKGDVKIMMKEGKTKTVKNVLFVPGINRNVLCIDQLRARGYSIRVVDGKSVIHDRTGKQFGDQAMWDERGIAVCLQVVEGSLTS